MKDGLNPVRFLSEVVLPALGRRLDQAFPEFKFRHGNDGWWIAEKAPAAYAGYGPEQGKLTACESGFRSYKEGREFVPWIAYVNGGAYPRGRVYVDSVRDLAKRANVNASAIREASAAEDAAGEEEHSHRARVLEVFLRGARECLAGPSGDDARAYLNTRGFSDDDIAVLDFGLYTNCDAVLASMKSAGIDRDDIQRSGLLRDGRWAGRVVGAWRAPDGTIGQFFAREISATSDPGSKYLYLTTGESGWGRKKKDLVAFGLDAALRCPGGGPDRGLIVVEGVLAAWKLRVRGLPNTVAIGGGGSELGVERWRALARHGVRRVVLVVDNDPKPDGSWPGREGLLRAIANHRRSGVALRLEVVDPRELGDEKGPDDFVDRAGIDAFRGVLETRAPSHLFTAFALLDGVTPTTPEPERRDAVEQLAEHVTEKWAGPWRELDLHALTKAASSATGFPQPVLVPIFDEAADRARRTRERLSVLRALGDGQRALELGRDLPAVVTVVSRSLAAAGSDVEPAPTGFDVDALLRESRELPSGLCSGFRTLDDDEHGPGLRFCPGELSVVGARTGHLKTTFTVALLLQMTLSTDEEVSFSFLSFEESRLSVFHRLVAQLAAMAGAAWSPAEVRDFLQAGFEARSESYEWRDVNVLRGSIETLRAIAGRLDVVYCPGWTPADVAAHLESRAKEAGLRAAFADYLQRMPPGEKAERRDIAVSNVARALKDLAVRLDIPIVVSAQINREAIKDGQRIPSGLPFESDEVQSALRSRRPQLHHLREGGSEQEVDQTLGVLNLRADFIEDAGRKSTVPAITPAEITILKRRLGQSGVSRDLDSHARSMLLVDPVG